MKFDETFTEKFTHFTVVTNGLDHQGKIFTDVEKVNKLLRSLPKELSQVKTSIRETMRIQAITMDDLIGTLMSYESELQNEDPKGKGKEIIAFSSNHDYAREASGLEDEDEDMALLTKRFKSFMRRGND